MKKLVFCLFILFSMAWVSAQTHSSADLLFPQYEKGTAILKDGTKAPGLYNYSLLRKQIQYVDGNGTPMTFANPQDVNAVIIGSRTFENTGKDRFMERIAIGDGFYYLDWSSKIYSAGKNNVGGHRSQSASSTSYMVAQDGPEAATTTTNDIYVTYSPGSTMASSQGAVNGIRVSYDDGIRSRADVSYYVKINNKFKSFNSAASLSKALGCCKNELEALVKKEKIDFKNPEDVHRMMLSFLAPNSQPETGFYDFKVKDINGKDFSFVSLKGKKVMIVNTASKCGNTPQYAQLEDLYEKYRYDNFVIVAFPANNFGGQEPGTNQEIEMFCSTNYGITFPLMAKISVQGADIAPVYQWLTTQTENGVANAPVTWNFQKFLINQQGRWVKTIAPGVSPLSEEIISWIEAR